MVSEFCKPWYIYPKEPTCFQGLLRSTGFYTIVDWAKGKKISCTNDDDCVIALVSVKNFSMLWCRLFIDVLDGKLVYLDHQNGS